MACKYMKGFGGKSANMILFSCDFNHSVVHLRSIARVVLLAASLRQNVR
jgi:hypothetical protein